MVKEPLEKLERSVSEESFGCRGVVGTSDEVVV
jgi:hypothetical protein